MGQLAGVSDAEVAAVKQRLRHALREMRAAGRAVVYQDPLDREAAAVEQEAITCGRTYGQESGRRAMARAFR